MSEAIRTCKFCEKVFSNQPNKSRHQNHYCHKNPNLKKNASSTSCKSAIHTSDAIEAKLQELINLLKKAQPGQTNIHYGDINSVVQNNVMMMNSFGNEASQHISPEFLTECLNKRNAGMIQLIDKLHFDPLVPENKNIKIASKTRQTMHVYRNDNWKLEDNNSVLHELINKGYTILFKHYIDTVDKDEDDRKEEHSLFTYFLSIQNKKSETYLKLRKDLYLLIENATLYVVGKV